MIRKGIITTKDGFRCLGGPGSGNFGHAGIPGQQGGSAPGGGGGGSSRSGSALKSPNDAKFDHKETMAGLNKFFSPKKNSSIEISQIFNETAGTNLNFEQIQKAQQEFSKGIRKIKDPESLMVHVEDIVVASDNNVTERIVASEFAHMYANRRGVNLKIDPKSVVGGTVPRSAFDPLWKK